MDASSSHDRDPRIACPCSSHARDPRIACPCSSHDRDPRSQGRSEGYCVGLEAKLSEVLSSTSAESNGCNESNGGMELPPHIFGALGSTPDGRETLKRSRALEMPLRHLSDVEASPLQRRAALWALGHAGSSEGGYGWLVGELRPKLLGEITELATSSPLLSLRGTCLFSLGLLSGSCHAARDELTTLG